MRFPPPLLLLATAALCLATLPDVGRAAGDGPRPGLPRHTGQGSWVGVAQGGISETKRAKQWARVPMQVTTAFTHNYFLFPRPGVSVLVNTNWVYLMAESGARHNYGLTAPFSVNTAAFGTIPVVATLRLSQERTPEGFPVPMVVETGDETHPDTARPPGWPASTKYYDTEISAQLYVEVETLKADGVNLQIRPGCRTAAPAELTLHGEGFFRGDPDVEAHGPVAAGTFTAAIGGLLTGTVDVPKFGRCATSAGEDVASLLTAAISGPGNAVTLHLSGPTCGSLPAVGAYQPASQCPSAIPPAVPLP